MVDNSYFEITGTETKTKLKTKPRSVMGEIKRILNSGDLEVIVKERKDEYKLFLSKEEMEFVDGYIPRIGDNIKILYKNKNILIGKNYSFN